jgi:two-component system, NarL family, sensor kinase
MKRALHLKWKPILVLLFTIFIIVSSQSKVEAQNYQQKIDSLSKVSETLIYAEKYDSAMLVLEEQKDLAKKGNIPLEEVKAMKRLGVCHEYKNDYEMAIKLLYKALELAEKVKNPQEMASIHINIGIVYFDLKKADEAIQYYTKALAIAKNAADTILMIKALNNIGNAYMTLKSDFKNSALYFEQTVALSEKINYPTSLQVGLTNLTQIYMATNDLDKATSTARKILKIDPDGEFAHYNMAGIFKMEGQLDSAMYHFHKALAARQSEPELKTILFKEIADLYAEKKEYQKALEYYRSYASLKDSLHTQQSEKNIMEIKNKYEAEKKDLTIKELSIESKSRRDFIISLCLIIVLLTAIGFYINLNTRKKKLIAEKDLKIKNHMISDLEKDKIIIASTSALKGEETERSRVARDLHDGLGGLLSGLKLNLHSMKNHVILDEATQDIFNNALKLLDNSVAELHLVANNMMPETLLRLGLNNALLSFINNLKNDGGQQVDYQFFGESLRFEPNFELAVYRVIQEMINNALKHSGASRIIVQLIIEESRLCATINDNGKGFDTSLSNCKGNGLNNMKARVSAFNGRFDIVSSPEDGSEIVIEFEQIDNYKIHDKCADC